MYVQNGTLCFDVSTHVIQVSNMFLVLLAVVLKLIYLFYV